MNILLVKTFANEPNQLKTLPVVINYCVLARIRVSFTSRFCEVDQRSQISHMFNACSNTV